MNDRFSPKLVAVASVGLIALVVLVGWFGFVSPQQSKVKTLDTEVTEAQAKLNVSQLLARSLRTAKGQSAATLLATAMPPEIQMPLVLKQVQMLAETSNVRLDSFAPSTATPMSGYESVGIAVNVGGRYAAVQKFLHRLRAQAGSTGGRIHATGRLYDVEKVALTPGGLAPNELTAAVNLSTFVYTGVPLPAPSTETSTTSATEVSAS
jgi:hypothetical protein